MKHLLTILALTAALLLGGCKYIHEDGYDCTTENNLTLRFSNKDRDGNEIFPRSVEQVEIFLFDGNDRLAYRFTAPQAELAATQSATLTVAPGTYRVVCWGNAKELASINLAANALCADGHVTHSSAAATAANGDPLYYAPYERSSPQTFTVEAGKKKVVDVRMRAAHIKMDFLVRGYATVTGASQHPYIEIANLYPKYDFTMAYMPCAAMNFVQQTRTSTRAGDTTEQQFNTPRFGNDNPVMIYLRAAPASAPIVSLHLKDELIARSLDVEQEVELTIPIVFDFSTDGHDIDVKVTIGDWKSGPLNPDLY